MRRRGRPGEDAGFALIEVLAAMTVLAAFFAMFAGAIATTYSSSNRSEATARTTQQLSQAFRRLDTQVRYASYVSVPGQAGGDWYVEFQNTNQDPAECIQLRVDGASGQLQQRSWPDAGSAGPWVPLASDVVNGGAVSGSDVPFVLTKPSTTVQSAQLTVNLLTRQGNGRDAVTSRTQLTFTALNTNLTTPQAGLCSGMRP